MANRHNGTIYFTRVGYIERKNDVRVQQLLLFYYYKSVLTFLILGRFLILLRARSVRMVKFFFEYSTTFLHNIFLYSRFCTHIWVEYTRIHSILYGIKCIGFFFSAGIDLGSSWSQNSVIYTSSILASIRGDLEKHYSAFSQVIFRPVG